MKKSKFLTKQLGKDRKTPVVIEVNGYIDDQFGYYKKSDFWQIIDINTGLSFLVYNDTPKTREAAKAIALKRIKDSNIFATDEYEAWKSDFEKMCEKFMKVSAV